MGIGLKRFLIGLRVIANPLLCYTLHRKYRKMADELPDDFDVIVLGTGMLYDYKRFKSNYCADSYFEIVPFFIGQFTRRYNPCPYPP